MFTQGPTHTGEPVPAAETEEPQRDSASEAEFLRDMGGIVTLMRGLSSRPGELDVFLRLMRERLAMGAEQYGDVAFLSRDNGREALEEASDLAAYAMMETQRIKGRVADSSWAELRVLLVTAAAHAALADLHLRMFLAKRDRQ